MHCCNCNCLATNQDFYHVLDMGPDVVDVIEARRNEEVFDGDILCQNCFHLVLRDLDRLDANIANNLIHCVCCDISLSQQSGRRSRVIPIGSPERAYIASLIQPRQIPANARACNACWQRARRNAPIEQPEEVAAAPEIAGPALQPIVAAPEEARPALRPIVVAPEPAVVVPELVGAIPQQQIIQLQNYSRTPNTPNHCFVPECNNQERLRVPMHIKTKLLNERKLYITEACRVCALHEATYDWGFLEQYEFVSHSFSNVEIENMLEISKNNTDVTLDFQNVERMSDAVCKYWTSLTVINFLTIFNILRVHLLNLCKKPKKALAIYLIKLRTGDSFARIASMLLISETMAQTYVRKVRNCMKEFYVPLHLGLQHIDRDGVSLRNLLIPQGIFGTPEVNPIVIIDGSYIYMQKSSNYLFQKKSYSLHKFRNLVKPMMFVTTDGHIIDVYGPYAATDSDADIMRMLFGHETSELRQYFRRNDVFILDRGFRDSLTLLASLGYSVYKPHSVNIGNNQLTTNQANESRLVTMCRWVVEVVNGRFKRDFKMFRSEYFNRMARHLMTDFRNAAAIINHFHPVLTDRIDAPLILSRALERRHIHNYLGDHVSENQLNRRRAVFVSINSEIPAMDMFPIMLMSDLILFCLGTYQIKQARSYYGEHIRANGSFAVEVSTDLNTVRVPGMLGRETVLIRGRIKSRHHSRTVYYTYILLDPIFNDWQENICAYYCSCIIGKRTVGSCAHVATIVWYLGWARYQDNIAAPAPFLDNILVREDL